MSRVVSSARGGLLLAAVLRGGSEGTGGSRKGASRRERDQAQASSRAIFVFSFWPSRCLAGGRRRALGAFK